MEDYNSEDLKDLKKGIVCLINDNNSLSKCEVFFKKLLSDPDRKVKIITAVGAKGDGKSTILNFIVQTLCGVKNGFSSSDDSKYGTIGIQYYLFEQKYQTSLLFLDCQGFDDSEDSNFYLHLRFLVSLICKISTVVIHITTQIRETYAFTKFLECIDLNQTKNYNQKNLVCNLIEVVNLRKPKIFKQKSYPELIKQAYYIENMELESQDEDEDQNPLSTHNQKVFYEIAETIINAQYDPLDYEYYSSLQEDSTYKTLHKLLHSSFIVLDNKIPPTQQKSFMILINESIKVDIKCQMVFQEATIATEKQLKYIYINLQKMTFFSSYFFSQIIIPAVTAKEHSKTIEAIKNIYKEWEYQLNTIYNKLQDSVQKSIMQEFNAWQQSFPNYLRPWENIDRDSNYQEINKLKLLTVRLSIIGAISGACSIAVELSFPRLTIDLAFRGDLGAVTGLVSLGYLAVNFFNKQLKEKNLKKLRENWLNMVLLENKNEGNFLLEVQDLLKQSFPKFESEILKINNDEQRNLYSIISFFNIVLGHIKQDNQMLQSLQQYGHIFLDVIQQYQKKIEQKSPLPDKFFLTVQEIKLKSIKENDFKYFDGLMTILNSDILQNVNKYFEQPNEWRNIFSCLVVLNNLHPNFLSFFFIEAYYSKHIQNSNSLEIFSNIENIDDFLQFQTRFIEPF